MRKLFSISILLSLLVYCSGSGGVKDIGKKAEVQIIKPNIRVEKYKETFNMKAQGPVELKCDGKDCTEAQVDALKPDQIKALKRQGEWKEYAEKENAEKKKISVFNAQGNYLDNQRDGLWTFFFEDGAKLRESTYKAGKKNGTEKKFNKKGEQTEETNYVDDKKNGKYWKKNAKGLMELEGEYTADQRSGTWTEYYGKEADMVKKDVTQYAKDKKEGSSKAYYPDGTTVKAEGNFKANQKTGYWKNYYDTGKIQNEGGYAPREVPKDKDEPAPTPKKEGEPEPEKKAFRMGPYKEYYKSGDLFAEGVREHTRKGVWTFYYKGGKPRFKGKMANEVMMESAEIHNKDGQLEGKGKVFFSLIKIDDATDEIKDSYKPSAPFFYYKNGKPEFEVKSDELAIAYDESGKKIGEGPIAVGTKKKNGCWKMVSGGKVFFVMDKESKKMGEMQGCK